MILGGNFTISLSMSVTKIMFHPSFDVEVLSSRLEYIFQMITQSTGIWLSFVSYSTLFMLYPFVWYPGIIDELIIMILYREILSLFDNNKFVMYIEPVIMETI